MTRVLYVATVVKTHIMEFHIPYLKMLKELGWETAVAAKNDYDNKNECIIPYCDQFYDINFARNPFNLQNIKAYKELKRIIENNEIDIVHCHTPVGGMIARLASKKARKNGCKVLYTAHGFHFYKGAPLLNWILYYPAERLLAHITDVLITITREDYNRALKFKAKKIEYIPGVGIDISKFSSQNKDIRQSLRKELGLLDNDKVLLSVGEVNKNKNHALVIKALPQLPNMKYVICGRGPLIDDYKELAKKLGVYDRVIMTGYRDDVANFYKMADIFVFPSIREGLPVAMMEAMASGIVIACSKNRGSQELIADNAGGLFFDYSSVQTVVDAIKKINENNKIQYIQNNLSHISKYDISSIKNQMLTIYRNLL